MNSISSPIASPWGGSSDVASEDGRRTAEHQIVISAPATVVYDWIAEVARWPVVFGPTVFVRQLACEQAATGPALERFAIWATVNGRVANWTSRRTLDQDGLRITFAQEHSEPPVAAMSGEWLFTELPGNRTGVRLLHHYQAVDDDPEAISWIERALDANSAAELEALRRVAELGLPPRSLYLTFEDTLAIDGAALDAYRFVRDAAQWADLLPHVQQVQLTESAGGVQDLSMQTLTADGAIHRTRSTRICFPPGRIVYKQHLVPDLLLGHSGVWSFKPADNGASALITARHSVLINPDAIEPVLGPDATPATALAFVRDALGGNGRATMSHAAKFAVAEQVTTR